MEAEEQSVLMSGNAAVKISEEERAWTHRDIPESDILPIDDLREYSQRQKIQRAIRQSERQRADKSRKPRIRYISKYRRYTLKDRAERRDKAQQSELAAIETKKAAIEEVRLKREQKRRELQEKKRKERELRERLERNRLEQERIERELKEKERLEQERIERELKEKERFEQERLKRELEEQNRLEQERLEMELKEKERLEQRCRYDVEALREFGVCPGIENYSRHIDGRKEGERP